MFSRRNSDLWRRDVLVDEPGQNTRIGNRDGEYGWSKLREDKMKDTTWELTFEERKLWRKRALNKNDVLDDVASADDDDDVDDVDDGDDVDDVDDVTARDAVSELELTLISAELFLTAEWQGGQK